MRADGLDRTAQTPLISALPPGWLFPTMSLNLDKGFVARYLVAVGAGTAVRGLGDAQLVPPSALLTLCLRACLEKVRLPADCLHISQQMQVRREVEVDACLTLSAFLEANERRGGASIICVSMTATDAAGSECLRGTTTLVIGDGPS